MLTTHSSTGTPRLLSAPAARGQPPETVSNEVFLRFMLVANIFGPDVIIVVVIAVVLLFGAGQLPKLARSVGEASKEFKKSQHEAEQEPAPDDKITLSKAELDALLAEREARAKRESGPPPTPH